MFVTKKHPQLGQLSNNSIGQGEKAHLGAKLQPEEKSLAFLLEAINAIEN
jgi:hypothetical protein